MDELMKVRDVSLKYGVSTRALKYYEDIGLICSTRAGDYAYRLYDAAAIKRLEQILILRKLNIRIKDIQRILASDKSEVVLDVLGQKVMDIDDEVAVLHELKAIVMDFIRQIERSDFHRQEDINKLYEMAAELENTLQDSGYEGMSSKAAKLNDVARRTRRLLSVRTVLLPERKVLLYDEFELLPDEVKSVNDAFYPARFQRFNGRSFDEESFVVLPEGMAVDAALRLDAFDGGLYAVGVLQGDTQWGIETDASLLYKWAGENGFALRGDACLFWNNLPAIAGQPPMLEMYIPIVQRDEPDQFEGQRDASLEYQRLWGQLQIKQIHKVDLTTMHCVAPATAAFVGGEVLLANDDNDAGGLLTKEKFCLPLAVRMRAKTDSTNLRLAFLKGALVFNWGVAIDSLIGRDPSDGSFFHHEPGGYIPMNQHADIVWILERDYMVVAVNGEIRLHQTGMPYMKAENVFCDHVAVNAAFRSTITVSALEIVELM